MYYRNILYFSILLIILMFSNFIKQNRKERAQQWDLMPEPVPSSVGIRPVLPFVDPETKLVNLPTDLDSRLMILIENHPSPEVKFVLNWAIEEDQISILFADKNGVLGTFRPDVPDDVETSGLADTAIGSVMTLSKSMMRNILTEDDALGVMIIIDHETMHFINYLDIVDQHSTAEMANFGSWGAQCAPQWQDEDQAYRHSCELQRSWGLIELPITGQNNVHDRQCNYLDNVAGWRQQLWLKFKSPIRRPECRAIWATLAGHPHPEVFK